MRPFSTRAGMLMRDKNEQALAGQQITLGTASSWAARTVKEAMLPSETKQVTEGMRPSVAEWLSLARRSRKGWRKFFLIESQREGTSWLTSPSASASKGGGRPSGMVSKRKSGEPWRALKLLDLRKRLWLYSVWTKVMRKPLRWSSFASLNNGLICPWSGYGVNTACDFLLAM